MWDQLAEPSQIVSILGQIPEYNNIEKILLSERHYNPALTSSLYKFDLLTLDSLRQTILVIRNDHFNTIKGCIDEMKSLLSKKDFDKLHQECKKVQLMYQDELEQLGITSIEENGIL